MTLDELYRQRKDWGPRTTIYLRFMTDAYRAHEAEGYVSIALLKYGDYKVLSTGPNNQITLSETTNNN